MGEGNKVDYKIDGSETVCPPLPCRDKQRSIYCTDVSGLTCDLIQENPRDIHSHFPGGAVQSQEMAITAEADGGGQPEVVLMTHGLPEELYFRLLGEAGVEHGAQPSHRVGGSRVDGLCTTQQE